MFHQKKDGEKEGREREKGGEEGKKEKRRERRKQRKKEASRCYPGKYTGRRIVTKYLEILFGSALRFEINLLIETWYCH